MAKGKPFPPGVSGNPGGRRALPKDIREALEEEAPNAIRRVVALSQMTNLLANPKTAALFLAANERVIVLTYGKDPIAIHLSGSEGAPLAPVDMSHYSDEELATLRGIQQQAERRQLAAASDAEGDRCGGDEADQEEV